MKTLATLLAGLALAAVLLSGCREVLDSGSTEDQLTSLLEKKPVNRRVADEIGISPDEKVTSVDCPSDQDIEKGAEFECTVTFANGAKATETMRIVNENADLHALGLSASK